MPSDIMIQALGSGAGLIGGVPEAGAEKLEKLARVTASEADWGD